MVEKKQQFQSVRKLFNDFSYIHHISDLLQLSQIHNILKIHSITKNLFRLNVFATQFERNSYWMNSESFPTIEKQIQFQETVIRAKYFTMVSLLRPKL